MQTKERVRTAAGEEELAQACGALARRPHYRPDDDDDAQDACVRALQVRTPGTIREPARYLMRIARNLTI